MDGAEQQISSRILALAASVFFLLILALPVAGAALLPSTFDIETENRMPAPFPGLDTSGNLKRFPGAFDAYLNDHIGFRDRIIHLHNVAKVQWLGVSPDPNVVLGEGRWLYYAGDRSMEQYQNLLPFSDDDLRVWRGILEARSVWLAARGIAHLVVVAPNKQTIYPEFVPSGYRIVDTKTRLDQLIDDLRQHSSVDVLDLRPPLRAAKERERVYNYTDTHWNYPGAFHAAAAISQHLAPRLPGVRSLDRANYRDSSFDTLGGDLSGMLNLREELREDAVSLESLTPARAHEVLGQPNAPLGALPCTWDVADPTLPRALVLGDSFSSWFVPYLAESFSRSVFLHTHDLDPEVVERERPNVVIFEIVERYLLRAPPSNELLDAAVTREASTRGAQVP